MLFLCNTKNPQYCLKYTAPLGLMGCVFTDAEVVNEWTVIAFPSPEAISDFWWCVFAFASRAAWNSVLEQCMRRPRLVIKLDRITSEAKSSKRLCNYWDTHNFFCATAAAPILYYISCLSGDISVSWCAWSLSCFRVRGGVCHTLSQKERDKFSIARDHSAVCCCWRWCFNAGN
jgi:hypothetical protein